MKYPIAKSRPVSVTFGCVSYSDPYRWLEEESPESQEWESAQNELTRAWFDSRPATARADALIAAMPLVESSNFPSYSGGRWFRKRTPQNQKMPVVEVTEALDGVWRIVVDLNQVSTDEILTIDNFAPSPDGCKLLIGWGIDGRERSEEHTSELQSLMRISYAVFCLKKKNKVKQK